MEATAELPIILKGQQKQPLLTDGANNSRRITNPLIENGTSFDHEATPLLRSVECGNQSGIISGGDSSCASSERGSSGIISGGDSSCASSERGSSDSWSKHWLLVKYFPLIKVAVIAIVTFVFVVILAISPTNEASEGFYSVKANKSINKNLTNCNLPTIKAEIVGSFANQLPSAQTQNLSIIITNKNGSISTQRWILPLMKDLHAKPQFITKKFDVALFMNEEEAMAQISSTSKDVVSFRLLLQCQRAPEDVQVVIAAVILVGVYILIIFELVHRALAAMIGALAAIAMLAFTEERPSLEKVTGWIDFETLTLLFGMMILVAIFCESGFFDWAAFRAYRLARGNVWTLITLLCVFGGIISAFLDNVTTVLLMTPVTIRLSEVLNLDPRQVLIWLVVFSNIGGTATAVGDPPNIIIVSNTELRSKGIGVANFTAHMVIGVIFIMIVCYLFMRFLYRRKNDLENKDSPDISELKHEIEIWRRSAMRIVIASREESIVKALLQEKVVGLEDLLRKKMLNSRSHNECEFHGNLIEMAEKYRIRDKKLLIQAGIVLSCVIFLFFLTSFIPSIHLSLGWIAVLGAMMLMVIADYNDLENLLHKVEWATLMFFAGLFILMKVLEELGLIEFIGDQLSSWIKFLGPDARLPVAIVSILWIAALASSFIDNIPFTTAMVPVLIRLSEDTALNLPLHPIVWALAFGTCLGGNGTLIGASANVVCAGIADQHGYGFSFMQFFKVGFPMMLISTFTAMCYLLIVHCTPIAWNSW
ncbi:P protein-like [Tubulanus polymorphus]|uniref:P protein-like n=1 Tax=Tubulanus polymorphus TaxID=672921 RepID=UPI003DA406A4